MHPLSLELSHELPFSTNQSSNTSTHFLERIIGTFLCFKDSVLKFLLILFSNSTLQSCFPDPTQLPKWKHAILKSRTSLLLTAPQITVITISLPLQTRVPLIITSLQVLPILLTANPGDANLSF